MGTTDNVNPSYYANHAVSPIDLIEEYGLGFALGNVIKYVARHEEKNGLEDLKKAQWYLNREIERRERRQEKLTGQAR